MRGLSPKAARALEKIAETKEFTYRSAAWTTKVLKELLNDPSRRGGDEQEACVIEPQVKDADESVSKMTVLFGETERVPPMEDESVGALTRPVGLGASADEGGAQLYFACAVPGIGKPVVSARLVYGPRSPDEDPREGNITVLQNLSRTLARDMGALRRAVFRPCEPRGVPPDPVR
ncbi:hypothetical protein [Streptomyces sp. NPDC006368]|uniref:hypothetical protein n=1 Tax=Streptomyces sp. NPDC006368 TaxID=3156760 RepID=UPI0033A697DF